MTRDPLPYHLIQQGVITHSVSITNNDPAMLAPRHPDYADQQQRSMIDTYLVDVLAVTVMALPLCIIHAVDEVQQIIVPCGRAQDCALTANNSNCLILWVRRSAAKKQKRQDGGIKLCDMTLRESVLTTETDCVHGFCCSA